MKLKLISALILSAISIHAIAYEGKGFKIISEKVTHSPNFVGGFKEVPSKKGIAPGYAKATSWAYDASGRPGELIKIQGDHNVSLSNYTSSAQRYTYTYNLNCDKVYERFERTVELAPQGSFTDSSHSYGAAQEQSTGTFSINVGTKITGGGESAWHEAHATLRVRR